MSLIFLIKFINYDTPEPWGTFFLDNVPPQMDQLEELHNNIMFYLTMILFALNWIAISIVINIKNKKIFNKHMNYRTQVELIWTFSPALILILITLPSIKLLYFIDEIIDPILVIYEEDSEWYWNYPYMDFFHNLDYAGYDEEVQSYYKEYPDHYHSLMDKGKGKAKATDLPSDKAINIMDKGKGKAKATKIPRSEVINIMDKGKGKAKATDLLSHEAIDLLRKKVTQLPSIPNKKATDLPSIPDKKVTEFPKHWGIGNSTKSTLQDGYVNSMSEYAAALEPYQGKTLRELNITLDKSAWPSRLNELTWHVYKCDPAAFLYYDADSTIISPEFLHKALMADVEFEFKNHSIKEQESITLERANMEKYDKALKSIGLEGSFDLVGGDRFKKRRFWDSFPPQFISDIELFPDAPRNVPKKVKTVLTTHPKPSKWYHNHLEGLEKKILEKKKLPSKLIDNQGVVPRKLPPKLIDNQGVGPRKLPPKFIDNKAVGQKNLLPKLFDKPNKFDNKPVGQKNLLPKLIDNQGQDERPRKLPRLMPKLIDNQGLGVRHGDLPQKLKDNQGVGPRKLPQKLIDNKPVVPRKLLPKLIDNNPQILGKRKR